MKRRMAAMVGLGAALLILAPATAAHAAPTLTPHLGGWVNAGVSAPFSVDLVDVAWDSAIVRIDLDGGTMSVDTTGLALTLRDGAAGFSAVDSIAFSGPLADVTTALAERLTWTAPATPADSYLRLAMSVDSWVDGLSFNPANGHYYVLESASLTWEQARDAAASLVHDGQQGYLATPTDAAEDTFVNTTIGGVTAYIAATTEIAYVNPFRAPADQFGSNAAIAGDPHWGAGPEAGMQVTYRPWFPGEPNGTATDRCLLTNWFSPGLGWNDSPCVATYPSVVEFGGIAAATALSFDNLSAAAPPRAAVPAAVLPAAGLDSAPVAIAGALALLLGMIVLGRRRVTTR